MNNYHIYEEVGRGKYSVVYKGRIKKSIKYVAVKSVERSRRKKLMNEVRIFHDLTHRNILKFYNWYETRNHLWIIFEYCAAGDLYQLIEQDKKLPEDTVRKFGIELVEGLAYLHENSIIYSDLKPANVLVNEYGVLKLCDFGLSKKIEDLIKPDSDPTKPKAGTPYYMAPELFQDNGIHSFSSDFWSLGCMLFEMATGKPPFCTNSLKDLIALILTADVPRVEGFSQDFNDLIRRLLEKDPIRRVSWDDLRSHSFWVLPASGQKHEFARRVFPQQLQFDNYLRQRGIVPEHFYAQQKNPLAKQFLQAEMAGGMGGGKVDIMRLSHNVRRNLKREEEESNGGQYGQQNGANSNNQVEFSNFARGQSAQNSAMAVGSAAALMMVGGSGAGSGQGPQADPILQVGEDDINLNNRRIVLNFGEKGDDGTDGDSTSQSSSSAGSQTPSHSNTGFSQQQQQIDIDVPNNPGFNYNNRPPLIQQQQQHQMSDKQMYQNSQPLVNNIFQNHRGSDSSNHPKSHGAQNLQYEIDNQPEDSAQIMKTGHHGTTTKKSSAGVPHIKQAVQKQHSANITLSSPTRGMMNEGTQQQVQSVMSNNSSNFSIKQPQAIQAQKDLNKLLNQQVSTTQQQLSQQQQQFLLQQQQQKQQQILQAQQQNDFSGYSTSNSQFNVGTPQIQKNVPIIQANLQQNQNMMNNQMSQQNQQQNMMAKAPHKTLDQLLIHNSDQAVKPIIGNKEIEKQVEIAYDPNYLTFQPWTPDQILQRIETPQIETHLNDLYQAIAQENSSQEKINALLYFESIVVNSNVSNRLINSAFMTLLVKMMKTIKTPQIRIRLCSVIGLLIRHSTVIENELAESDICNQLIEIMKDKNEKVRKKAIAALGEYMFYAATQLDDEQADQCWEISNEAILTIIRSLRPDEDETVRFYACKTLENITAQSNSAGDRFAVPESVDFLLRIYLTGPQSINENLRTSAAVALSHICKLRPGLFPSIFNKMTSKMFCYTLQEGQARVQQAFITMLNQSLSLDTYPKMTEILLNEESFLPCLLRMVEHQSIVIRGKVLLTFLLLFRMNFRWMGMFDPEVKFYHILDRLSRDQYRYVQCCLQCLVAGIDELMPVIFQTISEELHILLNGGRAPIQSEFDRKISRSEFELLQGNLVYIAIILDLQQAQVVKSRIVKHDFLKNIAHLIDYCDITSFQGAEEFLHALLLIIENLSQNSKLLLQLNEPILNFLFKVLLQKIKSQSADIRFLSLKVFTDIITQFLGDQSVYDPETLSSNQSDQQLISENGNNIRQTTKFLNDLMQKDLFPLFKRILQDNDPVPLFSLKLLSAIISKFPPFVQDLKKHDLIRYITDNYVINHTRLNRHTINILKCILEAKELSVRELSEQRIIERTHEIIKSMLKNKQDWCTEILLDIVHELLNQFHELSKQQNPEVNKLIDELFNNFDICIQLLSPQYELQIIEKASQCLVQMLQLYAMCTQKNKQLYFEERHMQFLISGCETDTKIIQKRILKCIYWSLIQTEYQMKLPRDKRNALEKIASKLAQSDERSINTTSKEILKILSEMAVGGGAMSNANANAMQQQMLSNTGNDMGYNQYNMNQQVNFYHNMKQQ